ncbi:hypothetical protein DS909_09865 [Phaeobacter gallaeciensis]|uniref:Uncharacterized protein n=1 Tax=Phaeobacter gallaeciensis TaxID=60890 RepID=A0A366WYB8_9RHOB|nr:hypothetical protein DS909_09865 [Phaeobacter gallaeciensis]
MISKILVCVDFLRPKTEPNDNLLKVVQFLCILISLNFASVIAARDFELKLIRFHLGRMCVLRFSNFCGGCGDHL